MGDLFLSVEVWLPILAGIGLSFFIEQFLKPGTIVFWKRQFSALAIHLGLWLILFSLQLLIFQRPWFATTMVLAFLLFLVQVSNAKFHSLREPFIFQDFEYFKDVLKHPRLFLPFLGIVRTLIITAGFGGAIYAGMALETSLTKRFPAHDFFLLIESLLIIGLTLLRLGALNKLTVTFKPELDLDQLGLMSSVWRYAEEERNYPCVLSIYDFEGPAQVDCGMLPNLVVVQSESFFDVRRLFSGIRRDVLQNFDRIKASAICQGRLEVPAWGANTVRTEFSFLSGLGFESLGVHQFNPYRKFAQQDIPTLVGFLKSLGYRTVCVHPYIASFYNRNKVFSLFGFDDFIDIYSFNSFEKTDPYINDVALAEKVCSLLVDNFSVEPIFIFVISMENHGPLHLEKVLNDDVEQSYLRLPPNGCEELTIYLRHLRNADRMAGMLQEQLNSLTNNSWLCWYGDHVPIMSKVYGRIGLPDGHTDYLIWKKDDDNSGKETRLDLKVQNLSYLLLQKMGLYESFRTG